MGLFDMVKKTKKSEWNVDKKPTLIDLQDTHIHFTGAAKEFDVFYKDIINITREVYIIKIETHAEKYELVPRKIRKAKDLSEGMYNDLFNKVNEFKK